MRVETGCRAGTRADTGQDPALLRSRRLQFQEKQLHAAEQERKDVAQARAVWRLNQPDPDIAGLVFLNARVPEAIKGSSTKTTRLHGCGPGSKRLVGPVPQGQWTTITVVAGLRHHAGMAPLVIDRLMNGERFLA